MAKVAKMAKRKSKGAPNKRYLGVVRSFLVRAHRKHNFQSAEDAIAVLLPKWRGKVHCATLKRWTHEWWADLQNPPKPEAKARRRGPNKARRRGPNKGRRSVVRTGAATAVPVLDMAKTLCRLEEVLNLQRQLEERGVSARDVVYWAAEIEAVDGLETFEQALALFKNVAAAQTE